MPPLRYLSSTEVAACLPPADRRVELAAAAMRGLAEGDAEMPPKIGVHPRDGALLHAMPAWLRRRDLVGMKWISAFPSNRRLGLPAINGLIVLNDAETGLPTWLMDAAAITAHRTAAVSGLALRLFARSDDGAKLTVAVLGAGVQARSHLELLAGLLPDATVRLHDRHAERTARLVDELNRLRGDGWVEPADSAQAAVDGAAVVITVASLQKGTAAMTPDWLAPSTLVVAVDFATYVTGSVATAAAPFVTDDRAQFVAYREAGYFDGYRDPDTTLGELLALPPEDRPRLPAGGRPVLVTHLGVGLADVIFADAIAAEAERRGSGVVLAR